MTLLNETQQLIRNLQTYTLDPRFEKFGNFILAGKNGGTVFWGNFYDYSAVFHVVTNDPSLVEVIGNLNRANQESKEYGYAKDEYAHAREMQHPNGYVESDNGPYAAY